MAGKKASESRRKLLKSIAAGSGAVIAGKSLPESWSKPVVDSVMLPAHAQTSGLLYYYERNTQQSVAIWLEQLNRDKNLLVEVMDTVVSPAEAQQGTNNQTDWCVELNSAGTIATITVVNNNSDAMWTGDIPTDGTYGTELPLVNDVCDLGGRSIGGSLAIINYTYGDPTLTILSEGSDWQVTLPIAPGGCGALDPLGQCNSFPP